MDKEYEKKRDLLLLIAIFGMVYASILMAMRILWYQEVLFFMLGVSLLPISLSYAYFYDKISTYKL